MHALDFSLQPKQMEAFQSTATEILYGGAVFGGKSHLMRIAAVTWCSQIAGLQVYLFRRIKEDLIKNHIEGPAGLREMLAGWVQAGWVEMVEEEIRFWNGSKIYLCHCKDEKDRFKYLGAEIHVLLIDELTTFTEVIYRFLRTRVRAVGLNIPKESVGRFPRILAGSNPGNVGHGWVKAAFIDGAQAMVIRQMGKSEGGMLRQYIPARLADNQIGLQQDPDYVGRIDGMGSPQLVRAMKDGDWDVVAGAYFSEFSRGRHVLRAREYPRDWVRFRALDWGSYRPFSVGWYVVIGEDTEAVTETQRRIILPRGALVRYREWYGCTEEPNRGLKLDSWQVAEGIWHRSRTADGTRERYQYDVADPAIFKHDDGPSTAERFASAPMGAIIFAPADNQRMVGWDQVRIRLRGYATGIEKHADESPDLGPPMLYFADSCLHAIRTVPVLQHDEVRPEDLDTDGEDHAADEIRYACMSRPWAQRSGKPKRNHGKMTFASMIERGERRLNDERRRI